MVLLTVLNLTAADIPARCTSQMKEQVLRMVEKLPRINRCLVNINLLTRKRKKNRRKLGIEICTYARVRHVNIELFQLIQCD